MASLIARDPASRPANATAVVSALDPHAQRPPSWGAALVRRSLRLTSAIGGGAMAFWSGNRAVSSRGPAFQSGEWDFVLPSRESLATTLVIFAAGTLLAFLAFIRGRARRDLGVRSLLGFTFLGGSLVLAYLAGAAAGGVTLLQAAGAVLSPPPEALFPLSLALAALGLSIGMRGTSSPARWIASAPLLMLALVVADLASSAGSISQGVDDLARALGHNSWTWLSIAMVFVGIALAATHGGRLWRILLAPSVVFFSLGMLCWTSRGDGYRSLLDALDAPTGAVALALVLALAARAVWDLRPHSGEDYTGATPTPAP